MNRHRERGSISLLIILSMSLLIFLWSTLVFLVQRQSLSIMEEKKQIIALYAAERGLVWALDGINKHTLSLDKKEYMLPSTQNSMTTVDIKKVSANELEIISEGVEKNQDVRFIIKMILSLDEPNQRIKVKAVYPL